MSDDEPPDLLEGVPVELTADERLLVAVAMATAIVAKRTRPRNISLALQREFIRWCRAKGKIR